MNKKWVGIIFIVFGAGLLGSSIEDLMSLSSIGMNGRNWVLSPPLIIKCL